MSKQADYTRALELAKSGELEQAQALLLTIDHPKAAALLEKVNKAIAARNSGTVKQPVKKKQQVNNKTLNGLIAVIMLIFACSICAMANMPKSTTTTSNQEQSNVVANDDASGQETLITQTIRSITSIDLQGVRVLHREDGYSMIMVTYHSRGDLYSEYGEVFGAVGSLVRRQGWDFDDLALVIGDRQGNALQTVNVSVSDVIAFLNDEISIETFSERMTITDF